MPSLDVNWNAVGIAATLAIALVTAIFVLGNNLVESRIAVVMSAMEGAEKQLDARVSRNRTLLKDMTRSLHDRVDRASVSALERLAKVENNMVGKERFLEFAKVITGSVERRANDRELIEVQSRIARIEALLFEEAMKGAVPREQGSLDTPDRLVRR